jgi:hypothetical protein
MNEPPLNSEDEPPMAVVPMFVPALAHLLRQAEQAKGSPLTRAEALQVRDKGTCMMLRAEAALALEDKRGFRDIDPEDCWEEWQALRQALSYAP